MLSPRGASNKAHPRGGREALMQFIEQQWPAIINREMCVVRKAFNVAPTQILDAEFLTSWKFDDLVATTE
jgi:hypothetical protein